jgi:hypothetical protein
MPNKRNRMITMVGQKQPSQLLCAKLKPEDITTLISGAGGWKKEKTIATEIVLRSHIPDASHLNT